MFKILNILFQGDRVKDRLLIFKTSPESTFYKLSEYFKYHAVSSTLISNPSHLGLVFHSFP